MARNARSPDKALLSAVKQGLLDELKALLAAGANANADDRHGLTALMWAARKNRGDATAVLVQHAANINQVDGTGRTALHHAVLFRHPSAVTALIAAGIDLDVQDVHGLTALDLAKASDEYEVARILLDAGARGTAPDPGNISIGAVYGGPEESPVRHAIRTLADRVAWGRTANPWCRMGHLNVVFQVQGSLRQAVPQGLHAGRFSKSKRMFMVLVGVPSADLAAQAADSFLADALRGAVGMARSRFKRSGIEFAADEALALVDHLMR